MKLKSKAKGIFEKIRHEIKLNKSYKTALLIFLAFLMLAIFKGIANSSSTKISDNSLKRPAPGSDTRQETVDVYDKSGELITSLDLTLDPRKLNASEVEENFFKAYEEIEENMLATNESLDKVKYNLKLQTSAVSGLVNIDWYSDDFNIINYNGKVSNDDFLENESRPVVLRAVLSYDEYKTSLEYRITVIAKDKSELSLDNLIAKRIDKNLEESVNEDKFSLPDNIDGKELIYKIRREETSPFYYIFLGIMLAVLIIYKDYAKLKEEKENRIKQMKYDYSELVSKLCLLLGSGMTIRMAWTKIAADYNRNFKEGKATSHAIYEEMYETSCNMQAGIPEAACYEDFARRVNIKEYTKFISLLVSNLKKGSKDLVSLLENETREAFELRKQMALQKGEEASTKLLIPMIMMLVIVMIIIMFPAVTSFGI